MTGNTPSPARQARPPPGRSEHPARPAQLSRISARPRRADPLPHRALPLIAPQLRQADLTDRVILADPYPYRLAGMKIRPGQQPLRYRLALTIHRVLRWPRDVLVLGRGIPPGRLLPVREPGLDKPSGPQVIRPRHAVLKALPSWRGNLGRQGTGPDPACGEIRRAVRRPGIGVRDQQDPALPGHGTQFPGPDNAARPHALRMLLALGQQHPARTRAGQRIRRRRAWLTLRRPELELIAGPRQPVLAARKKLPRNPDPLIAQADPRRPPARIHLGYHSQPEIPGLRCVRRVPVHRNPAGVENAQAATRQRLMNRPDRPH